MKKINNEKNKVEVKDFYEKFHTNKNHLLNRTMEDMRYNYLKKKVRNIPGKILVIGCGSKREMTLINDEIHPEVWGIEISKTAVEKMKKKFPKYNFQVMDACNMTFKENKFDVVVCSEVYEHLPEQKKLLESVSRILKKNGTFILTTPSWWNTYGIARVCAEFITGKPCTDDDQPIDRWQNPNKLIKRLKSNKYKIKEIQGLWYLPPFGKGKYRLPGLITYPIYILFYPFEKIFQKLFPKNGKMISVIMSNNKK